MLSDVTWTKWKTKKHVKSFWWFWVVLTTLIMFRFIDLMLLKQHEALWLTLKYPGYGHPERANSRAGTSYSCLQTTQAAKVSHWSHLQRGTLQKLIEIRHQVLGHHSSSHCGEETCATGPCLLNHCENCFTRGLMATMAPCDASAALVCQGSVGSGRGHWCTRPPIPSMSPLNSCHGDYSWFHSAIVYKIFTGLICVAAPMVPLADRVPWTPYCYCKDYSSEKNNKREMSKYRWTNCKHKQ